MKHNKVEVILKKAKSLNDKSLSRDLRKAALNSITKTAEGILEQIRPEKSIFEKKVLNDETPVKKNKSDLTTDSPSRSLSTRYSPDRVGVQARRISDGVIQDPISNKIYDWNDGFTTEDGDEIQGGSVSLQTDLG
jgi:hypothetical protein